jgi:hypothetical protein
MEKKERSEAQKAADARYQKKVREQRKYVYFNIALKADEAEKLSAAIKNARMTQPEFIRAAYEAVFGEKL